MFSSTGRSAGRPSGSSGFYHFSGHHVHGFEAEFDPFDLFAQMFGGEMFHGMQRQRGGRRYHYHHSHNHQQRRRQSQQGNQNPMQSLGPMLVMIVVWIGLMMLMGGLPGTQTEKYHSFNRSYKYNNKR